MTDVEVVAGLEVWLDEKKQCLSNVNYSDGLFSDPAHTLIVLEVLAWLIACLSLSGCPCHFHVLVHVPSALSVCLSVRLSVCPSVCLSVCQGTYIININATTDQTTQLN